MVPKIEIESSGSDILPRLLKTVHHFYPIGLIHQPANYPGTKELVHLADKKLENDNSAVELLKNLSNRFGHLRASEVRPNVFPRWAFNLILGFDKTLFRQRINKLHIKVSKLGPFYTVFHEESNIAMVASPSLPAPAMIQRLLSASHEEIDPGGEIVKQSKEIVETIFQGYEFVNHTILLDNKLIGTIPHGVEGSTSKEYSFYDLIFDNDLVDAVGSTAYQL